MGHLAVLQVEFEKFVSFQIGQLDGRSRDDDDEEQQEEEEYSPHLDLSEGSDSSSNLAEADCE